ncbi:Dbl homology domain-containing protein [Boletus reticuloceps]|uniref:Dbl homology domain-containing protein n=1 Tax=Boletus reticuloceps TaxID=495285 RepID=A0A8I2YXX5_9AGAM|nr:Dbl homology domain-containing protein [Boletus reticuloceps]
MPNPTASVSLSVPIIEEAPAVFSNPPPPEPSDPGKSLTPTASPRASKRRSFLPVDGSAVISLVIPSPTRFISTTGDLGEPDEPTSSLHPNSAVDADDFAARREEERTREAYTRALRSVMAYLKDMDDLSLSQGPTVSMYGGSPEDSLSPSRSRRPTVVERVNSESTISRAASISGQLRSPEAMAGLRSGTPSRTISVATTDSSGSSDERKYKDDKGKRALVIREIVETERTYVKGLQELVDIYVKPSAAPVNLISGVGSGKETVIPASERKVVFSGVEALFSFHKESFLPALEAAAVSLMKQPSSEGEELDTDGQLSIEVTKGVAGIFLKHAAFMKMYSSYINNFDNSVQRIKYWTTDRAPTGSTSPGFTLSPGSAGLPSTAISLPSPASDLVANLTSGQRKRIRTFIKRCRVNPRHSQLNMEGYLLLPVQRVPRYRLLLEELIRSTPPTCSFMDDALDRALAEISLLANNMNEGKRESETRRKLVQWQSRIRGKFPSPLVQPHRRLIMDGPLMLTRVVRKTIVTFENVNAQGDVSAVQVDCLAPELTPRPLVGILCNDLLVLCRDPSEGKDPMSSVDLWAVLRMQTLPQPASIVHGNGNTHAYSGTETRLICIAYSVADC